MVNALIIDDEVYARNSLKDDLGVYCSDIKLVGEAENAKAGVELISKHKPDLVFLDIDMPNGSGFDLLEKVRAMNKTIDFGIIFTTAHDKYALKAIKFSALDYLLKPIVSDELISAVKKASLNIPGPFTDIPVETLLSNTRVTGNPLKRIVLSTIDHAYVYDVADIIRCESEGNYTRFYFKSERPILISKTLKEYDNLLRDSGFERIHNSHLINLNYVKMYVKTDGGYLILKDETRIPISQRKKDQVISILSKY